jgi:hypothetical protein
VVAAAVAFGFYGLAAAVTLGLEANGEKPQLSEGEATSTASLGPVEIGSGGGGCGHQGKPMSPRNLAAVRGCYGRREKPTSEDSGLRGRRF